MSTFRNRKLRRTDHNKGTPLPTRSKYEPNQRSTDNTGQATTGKDTSLMNDGTAPLSSAQQKKLAYAKTMAQTRATLPLPLRPLSLIMHQSTIEKISDAMASTIARPTALLCGSFVAFAAILALYINAKHNGFVLSGSEIVFAFIAGWVIGILIDIIKTVSSRKRP